MPLTRTVGPTEAQQPCHRDGRCPRRSVPRIRETCDRDAARAGQESGMRAGARIREDAGRLSARAATGPSYHGASRPLRCTTLSPSSALTGTKTDWTRLPDRPRSELKHLPEITLDGGKGTPRRSRQIHLVHGDDEIAGCPAATRYRRGAATAAARRCAHRSGRIASSAVDAPVAMLRVYCSWPGVSAMMNFRRAVEK